MQHLPSERLSELADAPTALSSGSTPEESGHLASCGVCSAELGAFRRLVHLASDERRRIAPPLTSWESLRVGLYDEGLLVADGVSPTAVRRRRSVASFAWRSVAALALLVGGTVAGRVSAGLSPSQAVALRTDALPSVDPSSTDPTLYVSNAQPPSSAAEYESTTDALASLFQAQREYERAVNWLAARDTSTSEGSPDRYRTRLAALDRLAESSRQALLEVPEDPIINQYYSATLGAREAALRKLGTALPVGARLTRF